MFFLIFFSLKFDWQDEKKQKKEKKKFDDEKVK
jgi:hypothetical protein